MRHALAAALVTGALVAQLASADPIKCIGSKVVEEDPDSSANSRVDPSLNEAVAWLKHKLVGLSASWKNVVTCRFSTTYLTNSRTIRSFAIEDGKVHLVWAEQLIVDGKPRPPSVCELDFDLANGYSNCSIKKLEVQPEKNFLCSTSPTHIPYDIWVTAPDGKGFDIWVNDKELATRVAKALDHLIELSCGKRMTLLFYWTRRFA